MTPSFRPCLTGAGLLLAVVLAGCAGPRTADIDVTAFSRWPTVAPANSNTYRFDRLPSQVADPQRDQLEAAASVALARKGLQLSPTLAAYAVQLNFSSQLIAPAAGFGYGGPSVGIAAGSGGFSGAGVGFSFPIGGSASSETRTELTILVRSLQTNVVVYETRAYSQAAPNSALRAAMVESALRDFPLSTAGTLRTSVTLPSP
jgi:hypothetical protein